VRKKGKKKRKRTNAPRSAATIFAALNCWNHERASGEVGVRSSYLSHEITQEEGGGESQFCDGEEGGRRDEPGGCGEGPFARDDGGHISCSSVEEKRKDVNEGKGGGRLETEGGRKRTCSSIGTQPSEVPLPRLILVSDHPLSICKCQRTQ
jgi:hypothetical protein